MDINEIDTNNLEIQHNEQGDGDLFVESNTNA
jgi:hypothetical protein